MGAAPGRSPRRRRYVSIFNIAALVVFLGSLILAVGVFVYKDVSEGALASRKQELQAQKGSFSTSDIEALRELDRRISVAQALLDRHLSPSVVFDALEERTLADVSFSAFSYLRRESGSVEVLLDGTALRFNTVALQSRELGNTHVLASSIFSDLNIDEDGQRVTFTVTGEANDAALQYTATAPAAPTATSTATTTPEVVEEDLPGSTAPTTEAEVLDELLSESAAALDTELDSDI